MSRQSKPKGLTHVYVITFTESRQEIPSSLISPNTFRKRSQAMAAMGAYIIQHGGITLGWSDYHIRTFVLAR